MDKVKARAMMETATIKVELQSKISLVRNMDQGQRRPIKSLKSEGKIFKRGMIGAPYLERWLEDMDSAMTSVLELLDEQMKHLDINAITGCGGVGVGITDMEALEDKCKLKLHKIAARIDRMAVFVGGSWFRLWIECVEFSEKYIPVGQFCWFIDIVSYLQFVMG